MIERPRLLTPDELAEVTSAIFADIQVAQPTTTAEAVEAARESAATLMPGRRLEVEVVENIEVHGRLHMRLLFPLDGDGSELQDA